ncbi:hypothetical protein CUMW_159010 [Citrus unshiu]|uniref:Uncharacterized protein n=1 Tax=Citrus unshiu TaxID=55188 RepID=A0A2H5PRK6_CITUN|nr:hypothetical protein CUMW_159010 [Citrus unshiu]
MPLDHKLGYHMIWSLIQKPWMRVYESSEYEGRLFRKIYAPDSHYSHRNRQVTISCYLLVLLLVFVF